MARQPLLPLNLNGTPHTITHHGYFPSVGFQYPAQNFRFSENMANQICNHHIAPPVAPNMEFGSGRRIIIRLTRGEECMLLEAMKKRNIIGKIEHEFSDRHVEDFIRVCLSRIPCGRQRIAWVVVLLLHTVTFHRHRLSRAECPHS